MIAIGVPKRLRRAKKRLQMPWYPVLSKRKMPTT